MTDKPKLPVVGSSAGSTTFCAAKISNPDQPDGHFLWIDGNQKITAGNGSYDDPKPNAFSLEAQAVVDQEQRNWARRLDREPVREHCPGSTTVCRASCYVHGLEKHASDTYELYRHNSKTIRAILADEPEYIAHWAQLMADWITANAPGGFRWHVSGDIFSAAYAAFVAAVVSRSPDVDHWIYTRSFDMIEPLLDLDNLALNLSCDRDNYEAAVKFKATEEPRQLSTPMQLCYLTDEKDEGKLPHLPAGSVVFPDYALRDKGNGSPWFAALEAPYKKMVCPVDLQGKTAVRRCGPCRRCLL